MARISLERDDRIRTYRYRIKPFPQAINETNFTLIDRMGGLEFHWDRSPTKDGRVSYLLNRDIWARYLVDRD